MVTAAELLNTALESLADAVSPGRSAGVGAAKDAAAAGVLAAAAASAVAGAIVFGPKLLAAAQAALHSK
jgi:diacylglycerol kinase